MTQSAKRVLPADVYDALEFSALAFGGIGGAAWFTDGSVTGKEPSAEPVYIAGHAYSIEPGAVDFNCWIRRLTPSLGVNDQAIAAINARRRRPRYDRVSWKEYTRELNIVRGD